MYTINHMKIDSIDNLSNDITHLTINDYSFNFKIPTILNQLIYLNLRHCRIFNKELDNLPNSIQTLNLCDCYKFNQPLDKLPIILKDLTLFDCFRFNQPLDKLPNTLKQLTLIGCDDFNKPLNNLPNSLIQLNIVFDYNQLLDLLPEGLQILKIPYYGKKINDLPSSIKKIWIIQTSVVNKIYKDKIIEYEDEFSNTDELFDHILETL